MISQKPWLRLFAELNTDSRKQAKNELDINFYKLMNYLVFGKKWKMLIKEKIGSMCQDGKT